MRPSDYPLTWPQGWPRTKNPGTSQLKTSLPAAIENVRNELRLLSKDTGISVKEVIISSNVTLGTNKPADAGIAVWFLWDDEWRCFPVDLFKTPQENLQAIALVIEADRKKIRYGGIHFVRAAFKGYSNLALPPPSWRTELMFPADAKPTQDEIEAAYRALAKKHHPDAGGNREKFEAIAKAREAAKKEMAA